jgi:hypothetical protein
MRPSTSATYKRFFFILTALIFLAGIASAAVNGALQTTDSTGTVVNGNIYASKSAVYITTISRSLIQADQFSSRWMTFRVAR